MLKPDLIDVADYALMVGWILMVVGMVIAGVVQAIS